MNKITTALTGLVVLAAAGSIPAAAQTFTANGPFTFTYSPPAFSVNSIPATFNPLMGTPQTGTLSIMGTTSSPTMLNTATLSFLSGGVTTAETVSAFINPDGPSTDFISGFAPATAFSSGFTFDLMSGTPTAPVPEASTVLSFGALLALGGMAILRRKNGIQKSSAQSAA